MFKMLINHKKSFLIKNEILSQIASVPTISIVETILAANMLLLLEIALLTDCPTIVTEPEPKPAVKLVNAATPNNTPTD